MSKILILTVNYANEDEVIKYAKMLSKQTVSSILHLVIVLNKVSLKRETYLIEELGRTELKISIYNPNTNLGYLNGAIFGYNQFLEAGESIPTWSIVSNTDIVIEDKKFFEKFLDKNYDPDIWNIGPSIFSPSKKSFDNPHYVERCSERKLKQVIFIHERPFLAYTYAILSKIKSNLKDKRKKESCLVYSNHGCFLFLHKDLMNIIKEMNFEPFLYSEESFIAEIILLNNRKSYYDHTFEINHYDSSVTSLLSVKKRASYISNSLKYIIDKFY